MSKYRSLQRSLHAPNASLLYSAIQDMADCSNLPPPKASQWAYLAKGFTSGLRFLSAKAGEKNGVYLDPLRQKTTKSAKPILLFLSTPCLLPFARSSFDNLQKLRSCVCCISPACLQTYKVCKQSVCDTPAFKVFPVIR